MGGEIYNYVRSDRKACLVKTQQSVRVASPREAIAVVSSFLYLVGYLDLFVLT